MKIRYVGPHDAVDVDGLGTVQRGEVIDVAAEVAGRVPSPRVVAAHLELAAAVEAIDHDGAQALREEIVGLDVGAGLLAQSDVWELVAAKKSKGEEGQP